MERETKLRGELPRKLKSLEAEIGRQKSGSRRLSSRSSEAGSENWKGGISEELWKAFLIEEEFSKRRLSTPKESVDGTSSSSDDQGATDETENDEGSEVSDGSVDLPDFKEAIALDKYLVNTFISYEVAISPTGKVDQDQVEACKELVGKALCHTVGGLEYKNCAYQREVSWLLLCRAMGFGAERIPCIHWPVYGRSDTRLMYDKSMGYNLEMRCPYTTQGSNF